MLVLSLAGSSACGYRVLRYGPASERGTIRIETLDNDSIYPGAEVVVSEALRTEVLQRGGLRLVEQASAASPGYSIEGRVRGVILRTSSQSSVALSVEDRMTLQLELVIRRPDGARVSLPYQALSASDVTLTSADVEAARKNRHELLRRLSQILAQRIHDVLDRELMQ